MEKNVNFIVERFSRMLKANGCKIDLIPTKLEALYEHTTCFLRGKSLNKTWSHLFTRQEQPGVTNIIRIVEISIAMPALNAETESLFFPLACFFKRSSFENQNLENILSYHDRSRFFPKALWKCSQPVSNRVQRAKRHPSMLHPDVFWAYRFS